MIVILFTKMMRMRKYTTWPVVLLFLAGLALSSPGNILCVGDGGRLRVELISDPCCGESESDKGLSPAGLDRSSHERCVYCTDLPLEQVSLKHRPAVEKSIIGLTELDFITAVITSVSDQSTEALAKPSIADFEPPSARFSLSTTVLLC
jgi:hypothetical protein